MELAKGKEIAGENSGSKKVKKPPGNRSRSSLASRSLSKRSATRSKRMGKGLQFEDEEEVTQQVDNSAVTESDACSVSVAQTKLNARIHESQTAPVLTETGASSDGHHNPVSACTNTQPSLYSYVEHEMMDELFGGKDQLSIPNTAEQTLPVNTLMSASDTVLLDKEASVDSCEFITANETIEHTGNVRYSDCGLCPSSVSQAVDTPPHSKSLINDSGTKTGLCSDPGKVGSASITGQTLTKTVSSTKKPSTVSEFNIDDLFGF